MVEIILQKTPKQNVWLNLLLNGLITSIIALNY